MVAEQFSRVIQLAERAMQLEAELAKVKAELAQAAASEDGGAGVELMDQARVQIASEAGTDDELGLPLSKQMLAVFRQHPKKVMTGEEVARIIGAKDVNMIRSYLNRAARQKHLKAVRRGHYQWAGR